MAITFLMVVNPYNTGLDETQRSITLKGQLLPYNSANPLLKITAVSLTSNVVTFKVANSLTGGGGQVVYVAGLQGTLSFLNGSYTTTAATTTQFTAAKTAANIALTNTAALATLSPNYSTGGLAITQFYVATSNVPTQIAGIGPKQVPNFLQAYSLLGSVAQSYNVNLTAAPPKVVSLTNTAGAIAESANAAPVPSDAIGFYAEYVKGGF
jgi:hypothetical protein